MSFIDLSHPVIDRMPTYDGDPIPTLVHIASMEKNGYSDHLVTTGMHVGTHIDAPMHMISNGKMISDYKIDSFVGPGKLLDARDLDRIDENILETVSIERWDILLIHTGWSKKFYDPSYFTDYPEVTENFAKRIASMGIKLIGLDTASPDRPPFPIHQILLSHDILIIENLTNLDRLLTTPVFEIFALPIAYAAGGAPARVIARIP